MSQAHGYARRRQCPDPNSAKVCRKCDLWFNPRPRQRVCDGCQPPARRTLAAIRDAGVNGESSQAASVPGGHYSDVLCLTFKPGVPLWRILAIEAAAEQFWTPRRKARAWAGKRVTAAEARSTTVTN
jgi:hypothetical protein